MRMKIRYTRRKCKGRDYSWVCGNQSGSVYQWQIANPHRGFVRGKWTAWLTDDRGRATHRATADRKHLAVAAVINGPRETVR